MFVLEGNEIKEKLEKCDISCIDVKALRRAEKSMLDEETIFALSETFKAMSDPTRVKIITSLAKNELCVCDLAALLELTSSAVSHQLRLLRGQKLVKYRKEGKIAYYSLDDDHINNLIAEGVRHVRD